MPNVTSKEKFVRRFKKWKLSKNSTDLKWAVLSHKVRKRRINGKDSEIHDKSKLILEKKVRKEMSRHSLSAWDQYSRIGSFSILRHLTDFKANQYVAASPTTPEDMVLCTPKGQWPLRITFGTVPWFKFQERFNFGLDNLVHSPVALLFSRPGSSEETPISALILPKLSVPHTRDAPPTTSDMAEVIRDHEYQNGIPLGEQSSLASIERPYCSRTHPCYNIHVSEQSSAVRRH